jgi:hypothetical protein
MGQASAGCLVPRYASSESVQIFSRRINRACKIDLVSFPNMETIRTKPLGYNKLATLMGPNTEVAIFRRFGTLNMFSLLYMQAELMELERKFTDAYLDYSASGIDPLKDFCRDFAKLRASEGTQYDDQLQALKKIHTKLEEYSIPSSY